MAVFGFSPERQVPETIVRDTSTTVTMNGWLFAARPVSPMQKRFRVQLHGLRWYLNNDDTYDSTTNPNFNARALELFYEEHEMWKTFEWDHPHLGMLNVKFAAPVNVPAAPAGNDGMLNALEIMLVEV